MNIIKKYTGRSLWLAGLMMTALMAGCLGGGGSSSDASDAPKVLETAPADLDENVALNSKVVVTFSEKMDDSSITSQSFVVKDSSDAVIIGVVSYDSASKTASFKPDNNFTVSTGYTATVTTMVESVDGKSMVSNYVWGFTSGTVTDVSAPTVVSTNPVDASTGFVLNRNVSAAFSETLDPASVNSSSFTLKNGSSAVAGSVSYNNTIATFNPASNLVANTLYTATLTMAITDLAENALAINKVWTFETGSSLAKGPAPVDLRTAGDFVILTKTGITNVHTSTITGNIGASPITAAAMDNVFCSEITGLIYGSNAAYTGSGAVTCFKGDSSSNTLVANAVLDMGTAYNDAAGRTTPDFTELHAGDISGQTLVPGLYKWGTNVLINTDVTLNGGPNDVWIFQVSNDVIQASDTNVFLTGGAVAKNVFWQVAGGTGVAINTNAVFNGVAMAEKAINLKTGATVNGRLLSQTEVTLQSNVVTQPAE